MVHCPYIVYTNNEVYAEQQLSSWESGIWVHTKQGVPMWPAPNQNPRHWICNEYSTVDNISHVLSQLDCDFTGRGLLENCTWLPLDFVPWAFCLCWLCFVSFRCKSHGCDYMLSPVSPRSESPNPGMVLGIPDPDPDPHLEFNALQSPFWHSSFLSLNLCFLSEVICWIWAGHVTSFGQWDISIMNNRACSGDFKSFTLTSPHLPGMIPAPTPPHRPQDPAALCHQHVPRQKNGVEHVCPEGLWVGHGGHGPCQG